MPDIDIDFGNRQGILDLVQHTPARIESAKGIKKHNSGVYVTRIPRDPINNCAAIDYESAEQRGYFKLDFLNVNVYQLIQSQTHYEQMLGQEPNWSKLWEDTEWSKKLIHVGNYTHLLKTMKPDSVPRMAAFISVIRPGKVHLQNQSWETVFETVWDGDATKGFVFKKSHAVSYASLVALHMNLIDSTNQLNTA